MYIRREIYASQASSIPCVYPLFYACTSGEENKQSMDTCGPMLNISDHKIT